MSPYWRCSGSKGWLWILWKTTAENYLRCCRKHSYVNLQFKNWWFVSSVTENCFTRKSLYFTVTAIALALHTIVNYLPSCKKPSGACLHCLTPRVIIYISAKQVQNTIAWLQAEVWLGLRSTALFHKTEQRKMRLKSFKEGLRVQTHTTLVWTRQTALVHFFAFDWRMPSCRPVGREISLRLQSSVSVRCRARQEKMLLWLNTSRGTLRCDSFSIQVTSNDDKADPHLQQQSLRCYVPAEMVVGRRAWPHLAVPWSFLNLTTSCTRCYRRVVGNVRLPQTIMRGGCTLPMALSGVAGVPCCYSPGELLGCAGSSSVPRFPPSGARHPSPAGFLGTRMVDWGGHR